MLITTPKNNMEQVRDALTGITGLEVKMPAPQNTEWYMLVVRSNYHLDAVDGLRRQGLRAFWPSYERTVASRRMIAGRATSRSVRFGVLPYVLGQKEAGFDMAQAIERVSAIMDMVRTYSGNTLFLKDRDVEIVRRIQDGLNTPKVEPTLHNFKAGQKVKFCDDTHSYWPPGLVIKIAKEGRISVEVNMMGRKVPVTVFPHQIERI